MNTVMLLLALVQQNPSDDPVANIGQRLADAVDTQDAITIEQLAPAGIKQTNPAFDSDLFFLDMIEATGADVVQTLRGCERTSLNEIRRRPDGTYHPAAGSVSNWSCHRSADVLPASFDRRECYQIGYSLWTYLKDGRSGINLRVAPVWNGALCGEQPAAPAPPPPPPAPVSGHR